MKRKLITQMLNQWRSNIWMVVQLLIVSCVIFYIGTGLYNNLYKYFKPLGYNTDHTYQIVISEIKDDGAGFVAGIDDKQRIDDIMTVMQRIGNMAEVEQVAYSRYAAPYHANFWGKTLYSISGTDTVNIYGNFKMISPEYIKVFDVRSSDGTSQDRLAQLLADGKLLVSQEVVSDDDNDKASIGELLKSRTFINNYENIEYQVGAVVESTKRYDFDRVTPVIYSLFAPQDIWGTPEISVRLKPNADGDKFMQSVRDQSATYLSSGNIYVQDVQPYEVIKEQLNATYNKDIIKQVICIVFFLINIFLGLFGVFWFRTRQRTPEIALRKSFGATSGSVFRRLVSEGLLLLVISTPFVILIDWLLVTYQFTNDNLLNSDGISASPARFVVPIVFTALVMAMMIIGGICIPAFRAMRITPAAALHEE